MTDNAGAGRQLAVQPSLVADARRELMAIAAADVRLRGTREEILHRAWRLGRILVTMKERVGRGNWGLWLPANLPELGSTDRARQATAARCMKLFRENANRRNSCNAAFAPDTVRKFMHSYIDKKARQQLVGDKMIKPGAHHLRWLNEFRRWDHQVSRGHAELFLDSFARETGPVLRRIREILGPELFARLTCEPLSNA
jgi:hypothetical protein